MGKKKSTKIDRTSIHNNITINNNSDDTKKKAKNKRRRNKQRLLKKKYQESNHTNAKYDPNAITNKIGGGGGIITNKGEYSMVPYYSKPKSEDNTNTTELVKAVTKLINDKAVVNPPIDNGILDKLNEHDNYFTAYHDVLGQFSNDLNTVDNRIQTQEVKHDNLANELRDQINTTKKNSQDQLETLNQKHITLDNKHKAAMKQKEKDYTYIQNYANEKAETINNRIDNIENDIINKKPTIKVINAMKHIPTPFDLNDFNYKMNDDNNAKITETILNSNNNENYNRPIYNDYNNDDDNNIGRQSPLNNNTLNLFDNFEDDINNIITGVSNINDKYDDNVIEEEDESKFNKPLDVQLISQPYINENILIGNEDINIKRPITDIILDNDNNNSFNQPSLVENTIIQHKHPEIKIDDVINLKSNNLSDELTEESNNIKNLLLEGKLKAKLKKESKNLSEMENKPTLTIKEEKPRLDWYGKPIVNNNQTTSSEMEDKPLIIKKEKPRLDWSGKPIFNNNQTSSEMEDKPLIIKKEKPRLDWNVKPIIDDNIIVKKEPYYQPIISQVENILKSDNIEPYNQPEKKEIIKSMMESDEDEPLIPNQKKQYPIIDDEYCYPDNKGFIRYKSGQYQRENGYRFKLDDDGYKIFYDDKGKKIKQEEKQVENKGKQEEQKKEEEEGEEEEGEYKSDYSDIYDGKNEGIHYYNGYNYFDSGNYLMKENGEYEKNDGMYIRYSYRAVAPALGKEALEYIYNERGIPIRQKKSGNSSVSNKELADHLNSPLVGIQKYHIPPNLTTQVRRVANEVRKNQTSIAILEKTKKESKK
jgi:hypothetical protein